MKETFSVIALGITMSLIPNLLENKKINIKIPKIIILIIFWFLTILSMTILFIGYYNFNILYIIVGLLIYIVDIICFT